jgi:hypothetical protein
VEELLKTKTDEEALLWSDACKSEYFGEILLKR